MGPPLPESLPGLGVLTLVLRVLGSSLPREILHQAVSAFHAFVSPSPGCEPLEAGASTHCCLSQHLLRAQAWRRSTEQGEQRCGSGPLT